MPVTESDPVSHQHLVSAEKHEKLDFIKKKHEKLDACVMSCNRISNDKIIR